MMTSNIIKKAIYYFAQYIVIFFISSVVTSTVSIANVVLINHPVTEKDTRYDYPRRLLAAIFKITETEYGITTIKSTQLKMSRDRTLRELEKGGRIHVMAEASKPEWEQRLIPIRIPIR